MDPYAAVDAHESGYVIAVYGVAASGHLEVNSGKVVAYDQYVSILAGFPVLLREGLLYVKILCVMHLLLGLGVHLLIYLEYVIDSDLILHEGMEERSLSLESHTYYETGHVTFRYLYLAVLETALQELLAGLSLAVAYLVQALAYAHAGA